MAKHYRNGRDALDDLLRGTMDTSGVKTAKQIQEERAAKQAAQAEENRKKYVQLDDVITGKTRENERIKKLQNVIDNPTTSPQEKESAAKSIKRIQEKVGKI